MRNLWYRNCPVKPETHLCSNTAKRFSSLIKVSSDSRRREAGVREVPSAAKLMKPLSELNPGGLAGQLLYWVLIRMPRKCFGAAGLRAAGACTKTLAADVLLPLWMEVRRGCSVQ